MLEQLFGSKTRVQIITLFVRNPDKQFYVREVSRLSGQYINAIRRELLNLTTLGLLKTKTKFRKKFYFIDRSFFLYDEVKGLFLKSKVFLENDLTNALKQIGEIRFLVFTGSFTGADTKSDILIVGDQLDAHKLRDILEQFSNSIGQEIRYTVFRNSEYEYRKGISDKFLNEIFSNKNIVLIDKFG